MRPINLAGDTTRDAFPAVTYDFGYGGPVHGSTTSLLEGVGDSVGAFTLSNDTVADFDQSTLTLTATTVSQDWETLTANSIEEAAALDLDTLDMDTFTGTAEFLVYNSSEGNNETDPNETDPAQPDPDSGHILFHMDSGTSYCRTKIHVFSSVSMDGLCRPCSDRSSPDCSPVLRGPRQCC